MATTESQALAQSLLHLGQLSNPKIVASVHDAQISEMLIPSVETDIDVWNVKIGNVLLQSAASADKRTNPHTTLFDIYLRKDDLHPLKIESIWLAGRSGRLFPSPRILASKMQAAGGQHLSIPPLNVNVLPLATLLQEIDEIYNAKQIIAYCATSQYLYGSEPPTLCWIVHCWSGVANEHQHFSQRPLKAYSRNTRLSFDARTGLMLSSDNVPNEDD